MSAEVEVAPRVPVKLNSVLPLDEAYRLSQALAMANSLPQSLRGKPSDVLSIILYGQEIGLAPMQSILGIYVVNGRPTLAAQTWLALLRRAGHKASVDKHTDTECVVTLTRGDTDESHTETFTIAEARLAKLTGKDVWTQHPKRMLLARAVSNAARFLCPEVALGFYGEGDDFHEDDVQEQVAELHRVERPADAEPLDAEVVAAELDQIDGEMAIEVPS